MAIDPLTLREEPLINPLLFPKDIDIDKWIFDVVKPYIKARTLEIGSGDPVLISMLLNNEMPIHLSNENREICESLFKQFQFNRLVRSVQNINFEKEHFQTVYSQAIANFSTLIKLNRSSKQTINKIVLRNAHHLLEEGGYLIVLIPVYIASYANFEANIDVIRAINRPYVRGLMGQLFEVKKTQYLNLPGPVGDESTLSGLSVIIIAQRLDLKKETQVETSNPV